jgi:hypothetical protein
VSEILILSDKPLVPAEEVKKARLPFIADEP